MSTNPPTYEDILRLFEETDRRFQESRLETERLIQESRLETERLIRESRLETERMSQETDRRFQETDREIKETSQQIKDLGKNLGKQIGGLGAKFGSFTEGLALPLMEAILQQRFGMTVVTPRVRARQNGSNLEIDVLAYANGQINKAFIVEVKSHPREDAIVQLRTILSRFRTFFPEHGDKELYGVIAAVDWSEAIKNQALKEGFYVARIHDDVFNLEVDDDFQAKAF
jgi:hypothetical protein